MDQRVAKRYARALFNAARQLDVILSPRIGRDEKLRIAESLFSDRITALTMQALRLLLEKRRETELEGVREQFSILRRQEGNVLYTVVTTVEPLSEDEKKRLMDKL